MAYLTLPKILDIPDKLLKLADPDVFNQYNYFLIKGGRGGGKSQTVGRLILYLAERYKLRIVCGRETQNSINESVYSLLADLIREYQLNFEIQASKIMSRASGTEINFRGFREQGRFNIQGMEGIDIVWIDESQALTKQTLDVLIPTVRKPKSKVIFTMNPHVFNDPVITIFQKRADCLVLDINYDENKHCTTKLIKEAEECKKLSMSDYEHIWLGKPLDQGDDALYSLEDFENGKRNAHHLAAGYGIRVGGFDIARYGDDKCACVVYQQMGALHWEEIFSDEWDHKDLNYTTGRILMITNEQGLDMAAIDEDGMGAGPLDTLTKGRNIDLFTGFRNPAISYQDNKSFGNNRTVSAYKKKDMLVKGWLNVKTQKIIDESLTVKYTFDNNQRRILISKEKMRKDGVKSPNLFDASIMAVSLIGHVKQKQERQYEPNNPQYAVDDNLFRLAGVR